jgi:hypothetical protein
VLDGVALSEAFRIENLHNLLICVTSCPWNHSTDDGVTSQPGLAPELPRIIYCDETYGSKREANKVVTA